ncbi:DUF4118 domain-containing protein [Leeia oryzae]|uniref:DUF4118 domain-containing protein n=1 Tax=Leeia oryzae TaxID=356662 RepID=UPI00037D4088|nr:DUF4118 domain-containing protein [Leeia oryzae]
MDTFNRFFSRFRQLPDPLWALLAIALTTLIGALLHPWVDQANTVMLYLLTVVLVACTLNRLSVYLTVMLSVGMFDFFFVPPHFSFAVSDAQYLITFGVMMVTGGLIAGLTANLKRQVGLNAEGAVQSRRLYVLAEALAGVTTTDEVMKVVRGFAEEIGLRVLFHLPLLDKSDIRDGVDASILQATIQHGAVVETGGLHSAAGTAMILPLCAQQGCTGAMVVAANKQHPSWLNVHRSLLQTIASLTAIALERLHFESLARQTQLDMMSERLRSSVLSALSHDLRTPLTSLVGLADTLVLHKEGANDDQQNLMLALQTQAHAISHLVTNLLEMARLHAGKVRLNKDWQLLEEAIGGALHLLSGVLSAHEVRIRIDPDMPLVAFDAVLMERVIGNLLENSAKYAPAGSVITVSVGVDAAGAFISVEDEGIGFPPDMLDSVFDMFVRGQIESATPGVGLGLAIAKAIVDAHEGRIVAENRQDATGKVVGSRVICHLPLGTPPDIESE